MKSRFHWVVLALCLAIPSMVLGAIPPKIINGVLDLREWNFQADGPVALKGEWVFSWGEFIEPRVLNDAHLMQVPGFWSDTENPQHPGEFLPGQGYGTLGLRVLLPPDAAKDLGISLEYAQVAYSLHAQGVNGAETVLVNGVPGQSETSEIAQRLPSTANLPVSSDGSVYLSWHVSNYHTMRIGTWTAPKIGPLKTLERSLLASRLRDMGLVCVLLIMAMYHFALVRHRFEDKASLWFSMVCLVLGYRQVLTSSFIPTFFTEPNHTLFAWLLKLEYISVYLGAGVFVGFLSYLVVSEWFSKVAKALVVVSAIYTGVSLVTPATFYTRILTSYHLIMLVVIALTIVHLVQHALKGESSARSSLVGFLVVACAVIHDLLKTQGIVDTPFLAVYGIGFFIFVESDILATRFSKAFKTAERLTEHLQEEVADRTLHLNIRNKAFQDILNHIDMALFTVNRELKLNPEYSLVTEYLYGKLEVSGKPFLDLLLLPDDPTREKWAAWLQGAFEYHGPWKEYLNSIPSDTVVYTLVDHAGVTQRRTFDLSFQQITPHDSANVTSLMVITTDITERAKLVKTVEERDRELQESIAQVTKILDEDPELFEIFLEEGEELISSIEIDILALRDEASSRAEVADKLARELHTLKGTSAFYNQTALAEHTHNTEDYLGSISSQWSQFDERMLDKLYELLDGIRDDLSRAKEVYEKIMTERAGGSDDEQAPAKSEPTFVKVNLESLNSLQELTLKMSVSEEWASPESRQAIEDHWLALRKIPAQKLLDRFPRMVRDLSRHLSKEVRFECAGGGLAIDRTLVESLENILVHMIRNAVDHGIDSPEEREVAHKPLEGRVSLSFEEVDEYLQIVVSDDGRGLNPDFIRQKAIDKGIITSTEAEALDKRESIALLFHPGFSTAVSVTDVSGRGVGMDAVKVMVEELGGQIQIESEVGKGTTFTLAIPAEREALH